MTAASPEPLRFAKGSQVAGGSERSARFVLYAGGEVRASSIGGRGDVLETREFVLHRFRANPVVLADHDPTLVIGRGTASIVDRDGVAQLHGQVEWDYHPSNPVAMLIAGQHARGVRSAASIGFMPGRGSVSRAKLEASHTWFVDPKVVPEWQAGTYVRRPELYEWSSVAVPRDPNAVQIRGAEAVEQAAKAIRELLPRADAAEVVRASRDPKLGPAVVSTALRVWWHDAPHRGANAASPAIREWWESGRRRQRADGGSR